MSTKEQILSLITEFHVFWNKLDAHMSDNPWGLLRLTINDEIFETIRNYLFMEAILQGEATGEEIKKAALWQQLSR